MKLNQRLKKSRTQVGFEPTTFSLVRRSISWATESTEKGV